MSNEVKLYFEIQPLGLRIQRNELTGLTKMSFKTRTFQKTILDLIKDQYFDEPLRCPLVMDVLFNLTKIDQKADTSVCKPDLEDLILNIIKPMSGVVFAYSSQIQEMHARKVYNADKGYIMVGLKKLLK